MINRLMVAVRPVRQDIQKNRQTLNCQVQSTDVVGGEGGVSQRNRVTIDL
jgi:hypothetical protein